MSIGPERALVAEQRYRPWKMEVPGRVLLSTPFVRDVQREMRSEAVA